MQVKGADIGNFTEFVELQSSSYTLSERGVKERVWTTQMTVYARFVEENADTGTINVNLMSQKKRSMMTWDVPECTDRWRVRHGDEIWAIESINRELRKPIMNLNLTMELQ